MAQPSFRGSEPAHSTPVSRVALDYLPAAHAYPRVAPDHLQAVAQGLQPADNLRRQPFLYYGGVPDYLEAQRVQGRLGFHAKVHHVGHHLQVALGLHEPPHNPVAQVQLVVLRGHGRNYGVVGALPRRQRVGVVGVQREQRRPVLQHYPRARHHQPAAKVNVNAVDEGTGVALAVHHADVHRVAAAAVAKGRNVPVGRVGHGPLRVNHLPPVGPPSPCPVSSVTGTSAIRGSAT